MAEPATRPLGTDRMPTSSVLDVSGNAGYLGSTIVRRAGVDAVGRALTVRTGPGDNLALHRAVAVARPGDVLVVSCPGPPVGLAGEIICTALQVLGAAGLVTDSGIRDQDDLVALGLPVWSAAVTPLGTTKVHQGSVGEPVVVDGVLVGTGDVIVGDADGVVCVPQDEWPRVRDAAAAKRATEESWLEALRGGTRLGHLTGLAAP